MFKLVELKRQLLMSRVTSEIEQEKYEFEWRLKNIMEFLKFREEIQSPIFIGGAKSLHHWRVSVAKSVADNQKTLFLSLQLVKMGPKSRAGVQKVERGTAGDSQPESQGQSDSNSSVSIKAQFQLAFLGKFGETKVVDSVETREFEEGTKLGVTISQATFLHRDYLENGKNLRIRCEIVLEGQIKHGFRDQERGKLLNFTQDRESERDDQISKLESKSRRMDQMAKNWAAVLESGVHADVSIVTKTKTFPAHKVVLTAHSPVFGAMFHSEMTEAVQNEVEIKDFDENVVGLMLQFIYTGSGSGSGNGTVDSSSWNWSGLQENAMDLFRISDKYEISHLKQECELVILGNLTVENVMDILTLAHFHSPTSLKPKLANFLKANRREIQRTVSFTTVCKTHPAVIADFNMLVLD